MSMSAQPPTAPDKIKKIMSPSSFRTFISTRCLSDFLDDQPRGNAPLVRCGPTHEHLLLCNTLQSSFSTKRVAWGLGAGLGRACERSVVAEGIGNYYVTNEDGAHRIRDRHWGLSRSSVV
jgi:hypothetical protein